MKICFLRTLFPGKDARYRRQGGFYEKKHK